MKKMSQMVFALIAILLTGCSSIGGSNGGAFKSKDGGKSFTPLVNVGSNNKNNPINVSVLSVSINPQDGKEIFLGTRDSGLWKSSDGGENWNLVTLSQLAAKKIYAIAQDPFNPSVVYVAAVVDNRGRIFKTEDSGLSWKEIYTEPGVGSLVLSMEIDHQNSKNIYAGTDKGLIMFSENSGETWKNLTWTSGPVYKIAIDFSDSNLVYFAIFDEKVIMTRDGGKTFVGIEGGGWEENKVTPTSPTALATDPENSYWVYAAGREGLMRSKDKGENWEMLKILSKSDEQSIQTIAINPVNFNEIFYGAGQALYKSIDSGITWSTVPFNTKGLISLIEFSNENPSELIVGVK